MVSHAHLCGGTTRSFFSPCVKTSHDPESRSNPQHRHPTATLISNRGIPDEHNDWGIPTKRNDNRSPANPTRALEATAQRSRLSIKLSSRLPPLSMDRKHFLCHKQLPNTLVLPAHSSRTNTHAHRRINPDFAFPSDPP
ncbi:hypothetical protein CRG98_014221 [Punica granatum]|uniref:Uncharacterized protein n=1 Tax=Punica granatum TaxID=22663 RepID=A0A2I0KA39_PUNGR|nr:hypothetical protein CRG98_014221 [Punica granatum]